MAGIMAGDGYHDRVWEGIPDGVTPGDLERRLAFLLANVRAGQRVLDAGSGEGAFIAPLLAAGAEVVAVDVAREAVRRARERGGEPAEVLLVAADEPWPLADGSFDLVWAGEVIEHVLDTALWLSEVRRVLAPRGLLLVTTPDHGPLSFAHMALSRRARAAALDPLSDHLRFYTRATLHALLAQFGFDEIVLRGVGGLPGARRTLLASARRAGFTVTR